MAMRPATLARRNGLPLTSAVDVPAIAYFRDGRLVATVIGADQDVIGTVERLLRGGPLEPSHRPPPRTRPARMSAFVCKLLGRGLGR